MTVAAGEVREAAARLHEEDAMHRRVSLAFVAVTLVVAGVVPVRVR